jgi:uncharacterized protein YbgA (DUF1722 family)/uncharacterized protein YbbK (DUF523 family)
VTSAAPAPAAIRVGVSACLIGQEVRYDGQHKRDDFVTDALGAFVELVPVCPEVEVGLGVPRPPVRLVRRGDETRLLGVETERDLTTTMQAWAERRVRALGSEKLSGFVLKKDSPSCGMERVKRYPADTSGQPIRDGVGLFAATLMGAFPNLPVEEEGRLGDPALRENFVERIFAHHRWQTFATRPFTVGALVAFHTAHKLTLLAHSPTAYRTMGRLVAQAKTIPRAELRARYESDFMAALKKPATPGRHANVLQHMLGYFKKTLDEPSRHELSALIDDYRQGLVPLIVPITLFQHHVRRLNVTYLADQIYLSPHPRELMLRNRV